MEYTVYVLYSSKFDEIYIGYTSNLIQRFLAHNKLSKKGWSIKFRPWIVIHCEYFNSKIDALNREKQLKSAFHRKWIREQIIPNFSDLPI